MHIANIFCEGHGGPVLMQLQHVSALVSRLLHGCIWSILEEEGGRVVIHVGTRIYTSMHRTCLLACCTCWTKDSPKSQTQSSMRIYDHQMTQSVKLLQKKSICRRHTLSREQAAI